MRLLMLLTSLLAGRQFWLRCWTASHRSKRETQRYHIKLSLEDLPLHLGNDGFAASLISKSCSFHYSEEHSYRRIDTRAFYYWAWCVVPKNITKWL